MARSNHIQKESFSGIPRRIIEHSSFKSLSCTAHTLLILLGYQYRGKNNGNLVITWSLMKGWFGSNTTMFKARDCLYEAGFIVINAYGGRSGNGTKLPHLYALTWESIDQLKSDSSWMRYTHYPAKKAPLSYWRSGVNPDVKTKKERDSQFKKDVKKIKKTSISY